jgi:hypothetical protein
MRGTNQIDGVHAGERNLLDEMIAPETQLTTKVAVGVRELPKVARRAPP